MPNGNEIEHPSHYTSGDVECIDGIRAALGDEGFEAYCAGNVIKYVWRYRHKGGLTDVRKAAEYLEWLAKELELDERARSEIAEEATVAPVPRTEKAGDCPAPFSLAPHSFGRGVEQWRA